MLFQKLAWPNFERWCSVSSLLDTKRSWREIGSSLQLNICHNNHQFAICEKKRGGGANVPIPLRRHMHPSLTLSSKKGWLRQIQNLSLLRQFVFATSLYLMSLRASIIPCNVAKLERCMCHYLWVGTCALPTLSLSLCVLCHMLWRDGGWYRCKILGF